MDEEIYRKHADDLVRFATGVVGPFDAQDVVTDAWLKATHTKAWPTVTNHKAYLYRTVLNTARNSYRGTLRRRLREQRAADSDIAYPVETDVDVLDALDHLSERQRAVTVLAYWESMTTTEISEALDISPGSVKRHLGRAKTTLKKILTDGSTS
jgi:RNA polymerase sigma-70 factor (ECF subfamily)